MPRVVTRAQSARNRTSRTIPMRVTGTASHNPSPSRRPLQQLASPSQPAALSVDTSSRNNKGINDDHPCHTPPRRPLQQLTSPPQITSAATSSGSDNFSSRCNGKHEAVDPTASIGSPSLQTSGQNKSQAQGSLFRGFQAAPPSARLESLPSAPSDLPHLDDASSSTEVALALIQLQMSAQETVIPRAAHLTPSATPDLTLSSSLSKRHRNETHDTEQTREILFLTRPRLHEGRPDSALTMLWLCHVWDIPQLWHESVRVCHRRAFCLVKASSQSFGVP
ncbi:hypothetical protein V8E36_002270 [Tilletia maclaganii]